MSGAKTADAPLGDRKGARASSRAPDDLAWFADARTSLRATRRHAAAALLAAAAILLVLLTAHARNLGFSLLARATSVGDAPSGGAGPSDESAFEPFAFGVVGPVRGDAAALVRSVETLAARGDVRFVVLLGETTRDGDESELLRLAASVRDRGVEVVAVPSSHDLGRARDLVQSHLGAARWWFVHRECVLIGLPGDGDGDAAFVRDRLRPSAPPRATIVLTSSEAEPAVAADLVLHPEAGVRVVRVGDAAAAAAGDPASARGAVTSVERLDVATGPTLRTAARDVSLGVLFPFVRGTWGHLGVLAAAVLLLAGAIRLSCLRRPPDSEASPARAP